MARKAVNWRGVLAKHRQAGRQPIRGNTCEWLCRLRASSALLLHCACLCRCGIFLHSPFPSSEIFRTFPRREEVIRSMLNAGELAPAQRLPLRLCLPGVGVLLGVMVLAAVQLAAAQSSLFQYF